MAIVNINHVSAMAAAPRPKGDLEDILLEQTMTALTLNLEGVEAGRLSLMPWLR
jgi:hypothetical protein